MDEVELLRKLEWSVNQLERESQSITRSRCTWTMDSKIEKPNVKSKDMYTTPKRKRKIKVETPGAGAYNPNSDIGRKSVPGFVMMLPVGMPRKMEQSPESLINPDISLKHTSRYKTTPGVVFTPLAVTKAVKTETQLEPDFYSYNPNFEAVEKRSMSASLGPGRQSSSDTNKRIKEEISSLVLDVNKSFQATETRVKGVTSWILPYHTKSVAEEPLSEPLKVDQAWKAVDKSVTGVISWVVPPKKSLKPDLPQDIHVIEEEPKEPINTPTPGFIKEAKPTKQLLRYRQQHKMSETSLGPGMYSLQEQRTATGVQSWKKPKPTVANFSSTSVIYDTDRSFKYISGNGRGANLDFGKGSSRWKEPPNFDIDLKKTVVKPSTLVSNEESKDASDDTSSYFSDDSSGESKSESKFESKFESKYSEDSTMEKMARYMMRKKKERGSGWAHPSFIESADPRRYLILKRHLEKKMQQVPKDILNVNYALVEPSNMRGVIDVAKAESSRKSQALKNQKTRVKVQALCKSKDEDVWARCGIDPDLLLVEDEEPESKPAASGFKYRMPTALSSPARNKKEQEIFVLASLGPGKYSSHESWVEENKQVKKVVNCIANLKQQIDQLGTGNDIGLTRLLQKKEATLELLREKESMTKTPGRTVKRIKKKGQVAVVSYYEADDNQLGPGEYQVDPSITRYGKNKETKGVVAFTSTGRFQETSDPQSTNYELELSPNVASTKTDLPGSKGYSFSKTIVKEETPFNDHELDLVPEFEYGKFYEPGKHFGLMHQQTARPSSPLNRCNEQQLDLVPESADHLVRSRVRQVSMGSAPLKEKIQFFGAGDECMHFGGDENMIPEMMINSAPEDVKSSMKSKGIVDFAKGLERWQYEELENDAADYEVDRGFVLTKPALKSNVNFEKQTIRLEEKKLPEYAHSVYPGAEGDLHMLGGLNAKGESRKLPAHHKITIDMSKTTDNAWALKEESPILDLNIETGFAALQSRVDKGWVPMGKQIPRWEAQEKQLEKHMKEMPTSPEASALGSALEKLSVNDPAKRPNPLGHIDMSKWLGRKDNAPMKEPIELDIEPIMDSSHFNRRVVGGVLDKASRRNSPKTEYSKQKFEQGNILLLEPNDDIIRKNITGIDFAKQVSREINREIPAPEMMMASPHMDDVVSGLDFLKTDGPRVAVKIMSPHVSKPLEKSNKLNIEKDKQHAFLEEQKNKQLKSKIKSERIESLEKLKPKKKVDKVVATKQMIRKKNGKQIRVAKLVH